MFRAAHKSDFYDLVCAFWRTMIWAELYLDHTQALVPEYSCQHTHACKDTHTHTRPVVKSLGTPRTKPHIFPLLYFTISSDIICLEHYLSLISFSSYDSLVETFMLLLP